MPMNDGENIADDHPDDCECGPCENGRRIAEQRRREPQKADRQQWTPPGLVRALRLAATFKRIAERDLLVYMRPHLREDGA